MNEMNTNGYPHRRLRPKRTQPRFPYAYGTDWPRSRTWSTQHNGAGLHVLPLGSLVLLGDEIVTWEPLVLDHADVAEQASKVFKNLSASVTTKKYAYGLAALMHTLGEQKDADPGFEPGYSELRANQNLIC